MGSQAYIVQKNPRVRTSWFGLKRESFVELKAGLLTDPNQPPAPVKMPKPPKKLQSEDLYFDEETDREDKLNQLKQLIADKKSAPSRQMSSERSGRHPRDLESLLDTAPMIESWHQSPALPAYRHPLASSPLVRNSLAVEEGKASQSVIDFLVEKEFQPELAKLAAQKSKLTSVHNEDEKFILAKTLAGFFKYADGLKIYATNPNVIFLIGPTGVGKTTTLSKMAVKYGLQEDLPTVLATYDTWRTMAAAQLERTAMMLETHFRLLNRPTDLVRVIKENHDASLIFVDTGGTNFDDEKKLNEVFDLVNHVEIPKEVHLCLPAAMRYKELARMAKGFFRANFDRIIITKVDESASLGSVLSVVHSVEKPISLLATGQDVSKDYEMVSIEKMTTRLLKEWKY
jgi:flagellar biosynthesis protein FlhF